MNETCSKPTVQTSWPRRTIGSFASADYGYTAKAASNAIGPRFLRITDIQDHGVDWDSVPYCPMDSKKHAKHRLIDQDIVFARTGATTGKSFLVIDPPDSVAASYLIRLRLHDESISPRFLSLYFLTKEYWDAIELGTEGAAQGGFNASKLSALAIPIPPLPEQERIVAILDEAFEGIATATAHAERNLHNARELFQSVLQSTFQQKGEDWVETTLEEASKEFGRGKSKHRPRNAKFLYGGPYPFVQTGDIRNSEHMITSYTQTYSEAGLSQSKLWPEGTICITIAANIAETGILGFDACFPDSVIGMIPDPTKTNADYVEYLLQFFKVELQALGKGSAQDNINLGTFKDRKFPFAPLKQQKAIVKKLDALATETRRLEAIYERKLAALAELKQSLLQRAFSGKL